MSLIAPVSCRSPGFVTHGEGNALLQADALEPGWRRMVDRASTGNARGIFDTALAGRR